VTSERPKQAFLYRNPISYFGGLVVAGSVALIVVTVILMTVLGGGSPYFGIFAFLVLPMFVVLGLLIFLYGTHRESLRRRRLQTSEAPPYPRIDLNDGVQRARFGRATVGAFLLLILLAVVGYHGFLFTESVTFCGRVCHTVMAPEYTAYQASPHARVSCVECHVGAGAGWYVKSKLSGVRQVFAVLLHTYETPIPVPVRDLRPARETCEECHWPQKFYGAQLIRNPHFRYDESNTAEQITFLVKTGGGSPKLGQNAGIHFHMIIENQITFAASDEKLQRIPWVSVRHLDGTTSEYVSTDEKLTPEELAKLPKRVMDCMDCHNRPTHIFPAPEGAVDVAMSSGLISPSLPWIKKVAVDALVKEYPDGEAAASGIRSEITAFYASRYPQVTSTSAHDIAQACDTVTAIYSRSVFPEMKVNWRSYASNIGHRNWPGCFRCHDGKHVSASSKILTIDCITCHTMPQRGPLAAIGASVPTSTESWHPWELKGKHATMLCNRCHAAGYRPPTECAECHKLDAKAPMMSSDCDTCHAKEQNVQPLNDCATCHDSLGGLHKAGGHPDASCTDCHRPHGWKVDGRNTCLNCHDDRKDHYNKEQAACASCHEFTGKAA
jgi:hypothetical protein